MSNCLIIDFKNDVIIDQRKTRNRVNFSMEIEKEELLKGMKIIPEEYLEELEEADVIGLDFDNEEIVLYEEVMWNEADNEPYPEEALCEYNSLMIGGLLDYQEAFTESFELSAFSDDAVNAMADNIINAFFGGRS